VDCPPVLQIAYHVDVKVVERSLGLVDAEEVEHTLGWVLMGTIAGDNTLLIITRSNEAAEALMTKFNTMLNG